ncbi:MAG TPA: hypothetical protein VIL44_00100 [Micromonospora sp.]
MAALMVLGIPVVLGLFLLVMEQLELRVIGTTPATSSEDVLLSKRSGASLRAGASRWFSRRPPGEPRGRVAIAGGGAPPQLGEGLVVASVDE